MINYIERLRNLGKTTIDAKNIYQFFKKNFSVELLDYVIDKLEREKDVEEVQP